MICVNIGQTLNDLNRDKTWIVLSAKENSKGSSKNSAATSALYITRKNERGF
jgi:hypothetical protein